MLFEELLTWVRQKAPRRYEARAADLIQSRNSSPKFKGVLLLEVARMNIDKRPLQSWEAAALARASQTIVRDFVLQFKPGRVELFLATPVGLAVFLGHQRNAIGVEIQCHEWAGMAGQYLPSCIVNL